MIADALLEAVAAVLVRAWSPPPAPPSIHEFCGTFEWTEGNCVGQRVDTTRHPAQWHVLNTIGETLAGRSHFRRFVLVKPTQDGGTWIIVCFVLLYIATQLRKPVAVGFPDMRLASIAWREKIRKPVIEAKHGEWLPMEGLGSEGGGAPEEVALNGTPVYFMGGGSSNQAGQAGLTAYALIRDERDSMETYVAELMRGRLDGFDDAGLLFDLSTVKKDKESDHLDEYNESTAFRFAYPCPKCGGYQVLDDEQMVYDNGSELTATETARMRCVWKDCGHLISDAERVGGGDQIGMIDLRHTVLVGKGQQLHRDGTVTGDLHKTFACGFLWVAHDSPQKSLRKLASERWQAERDLRKGDHEKMRRYMRDRCCRQYTGDRTDSHAVDAVVLAERSAAASLKFGFVPPGLCFLTGTVDVQKRELWWQIMAHGADGRWWIVAHDREVIAGDFRADPSELQVREALDRVKAIMEKGLPVAGDADGRCVVPVLRGIDVRYQADIVIPWILEQEGAWLMLRGAGEGQLSERPTGKQIERIEGYVDVRVSTDGHLVYYIETHALKLGLASAFARPQDTPAAGHLPHGEAADGWLIKQLTAERLVNGKFVKFRRDNHQMDLTVYNRGLGRYGSEHGALDGPRVGPGPAEALAAVLDELPRRQRRF